MRRRRLNGRHGALGSRAEAGVERRERRKIEAKKIRQRRRTRAWEKGRRKSQARAAAGRAGSAAQSPPEERRRELRGFSRQRENEHPSGEIEAPTSHAASQKCECFVGFFRLSSEPAASCASEKGKETRARQNDETAFLSCEKANEK
ncbi:hypothetical protein BESB_006510 [Besnoitia besnoiti]|uniref:Uncharacterized protein n=1 Tax=Besnoitia besnoiti TaxID=94643 RepID=A0A2A9MQI5_BESBE|nr:hypothetical protein BESB_006510 [Besnoitia besnoiti]PFH38310.1 hypothetical protein BESB_006510 [Besnoitia besnoiti]